MPHAGGRLLKADSRETRLLADWLKAGAPGPIKDEAIVTKLIVSPTNVVLSANQSQPLTVEAEYSDGRKRDVTWLTKFAANDTAVADVDRDGKLTAVRSGETAVVATFDGQVATAIVTIPFGSQAVVTPSNLSGAIDPHVFAKLTALRIESAGLASDEEFLRRVFLDSIGTLPTPD